MVDPRAPRFGQAVTAGVLTVGIAFQSIVPIALVAFILTTSVITRWRVDVYALIWRHIVVRVVGKPDEKEPASPHRFAKLLGTVGTMLATILLYVEVTIPGYGIAAVVAVLAAVAASTGFCLGCRMYRQVSFLRKYNIV